MISGGMYTWSRNTREGVSGMGMKTGGTRVRWVTVGKGRDVVGGKKFVIGRRMVGEKRERKKRLRLIGCGDDG